MRVRSVDEFPKIADRVLEYPALLVPVRRTSELRKKLSHVLLRKPRTTNVYKPKNGDGDNNKDKEFRVLVLSNRQSLQDEVVQELLRSSNEDNNTNNIISETTWELPWTYEQMTAEEALRLVLPNVTDETEIPTSYESVGTIAHVNLRSELLPYKYWVGKVLFDKNRPSIKTVVNKLGTIETEYRTFGMEVIAGYGGDDPPWSIATVKEEGSVFDLDFTKVYWNSRLAGEHKRLVNVIKEDFQQKRRTIVVVDLMAGIGPFAIPLAAMNNARQKQQNKNGNNDNKIVVHANDLNPDSYKWLVHNSTKKKSNKCSNLHCYNMDARQFVRDVLMKDDNDEGVGVGAVDHVIMNLPATAPEFLDAFRGYRIKGGKSLPQFHVHCFAPKESEKGGYRDAIRRCEEALGCALDDNAAGAKVRTVRNVAPKKNMVCVTFQLPEAVCNLPPIALNRNNNTKPAAAAETDLVQEPPDAKRLKTTNTNAATAS